MSTHVEETINNFPRDMQWGASNLVMLCVPFSAMTALTLHSGQGVQLMEDFTKFDSPMPTFVRFSLSVLDAD